MVLNLSKQIAKKQTIRITKNTGKTSTVSSSKPIQLGADTITTVKNNQANTNRIKIESTPLLNARSVETVLILTESKCHSVGTTEKAVSQVTTNKYLKTTATKTGQDGIQGKMGRLIQREPSSSNSHNPNHQV